MPREGTLTSHIYPGADHTTQWFHPACPGDTMPHPNVIVLHTTEGSSWPSYGGGSSAPTFTVHPDGRVRQHFYANESARALVNAAGGVQTNTLNVVQIELIGTCAKGGPGIYWPSATAAQLAGVAKLVKWLTATYPIPLRSTTRQWLAYPSSYGSKSGQRMSASEWNSFSGLCGHQHVPENDHGDPGAFPIQRLIDAVKPPASTPPTSPPKEQSMAISRDDVHTILGTDGILAAPEDVDDDYWTLATHICHQTKLARQQGAELDALRDQVAELKALVQQLVGGKAAGA